jgi:hypothetical protein
LLKLETCLNYFTQLTAVSHRGLLLVSSVACGTCDRARRTGESCLPETEVPFEGTEPNQPDSIFARSPGFILVSSNFRFHQPFFH